MSTATKTLVAYHGEEALKARIMAQIQAHREADEIAQGSYYRENGKLKVCAVGCVLHDPEGGHAAYETEFGIPAQLAHLEDCLFESMPLGEAKEWPARFMGAIEPGADLTLVWPRFAVWLMIDPEWGVVNVTDDEDAQAICRRVANGYQWVVDRDALSAKDANALAQDARDPWDAWDAWDARAAWDAQDARDPWDVWAARAAWAAWAARDVWDAQDARDPWDVWAARAARAAWAARAARAAWAARDARDAFVLVGADELIRLLGLAEHRRAA